LFLAVANPGREDFEHNAVGRRDPRCLVGEIAVDSHRLRPAGTTMDGVNHNSREVRKVFTYIELFKPTPEGRENLTDTPKYLETIVTEEGSTTAS
jgi:hypothetical protein